MGESIISLAVTLSCHYHHTGFTLGVLASPLTNQGMMRQNYVLSWLSKCQGTGTREYSIRGAHLPVILEQGLSLFLPFSPKAQRLISSVDNTYRQTMTIINNNNGFINPSSGC